MIQRAGKVFLKVATHDTDVIPSVWCDIVIKDGNIGQARFNYDPNYSKGKKEVRVNFDLYGWKIRDLLQSKGGLELLEDIVVSMFIFVLKDNNGLYKNLDAFMVVHHYDEDLPETNEINSAIIQVLKKLGAEVRNGDEFILNSQSLNSLYLKEIINRR